MSENHNIASEFRKHPDRAKWLVDKILPAMQSHFEDFDVDYVIGALTDESMDAKKIKSLFNSHVRKQNSFRPKDVSRARPAYQFFCDDHRSQLKEDNEDLSFGEINKKLGEMWAAQSEKERNPYDKKAKADKLRYQTEFKSAEDKAIASGEYKPNPLRGVKKPRTSYLCFSTDPAIRKKYGKKTSDIKELMRILGKEWKKMSDKEKQPYVEQAEEDKARFEKEKAVALKVHKKLQDSLNKNKNDDNDNDNDNDNEDEDEVHVPKSTKSKSTKSKSGKSKKSSSKKQKKQSVSSDENDE
jgi:hypothetical protein